MGDPVPGRPRDTEGSPVEMIILSRPCKLSKFMTAPERSRRGMYRRKDKELEKIEAVKKWFDFWAGGKSVTKQGWLNLNALLGVGE